MVNFIEWASGIYQVIGDIGKKNEIYASYLIFGDERIAVIDIPTRAIGKEIIKFIKNYGRDPSELSFLVLTHTHPDHWAGMSAFSKIKPEVWLHSSGLEALKQGNKYILEKAFPYVSKFSLAMKSSLFSKIGRVKEELIQTFDQSETLDLGGEELILQHTGGHSSDSILIQAYRGRCTFIGDEGNIYPDNPASFFIDGTGDSQKRFKLLNLLSNIKTETICPSHQSPIPKPYDLYLHNLLFEHNHTKDTIYDLLLSAGEAKSYYLAEEYAKILGVHWETPFKELGVSITTVVSFLEELKRENRITYESHTERWRIV
ncbi:MAG: MBL fold metallo-hydrolase [Candidatus Hodarchaeales archaeon]